MATHSPSAGRDAENRCLRRVSYRTSHYPNGSTEMIQRCQERLVSMVRHAHRVSQATSAWPGKDQGFQRHPGIPGAEQHLHIPQQRRMQDSRPVLWQTGFNRTRQALPVDFCLCSCSKIQSRMKSGVPEDLKHDSVT